MLIFADKGLTVLATPKTGSTALEMALRPKADIIFAKQRKHITAQRYRSKIAPFLAKTFGIETETCAVMRAPVDQLRSWYRYRARDGIADPARSTRHLTFDAFIAAVISDAPPEYARVGSQFTFLTGGTGEVLVDHLFGYDQRDLLLAFLSKRLGAAVAPKRRNVSPRKEAPLSDEMHKQLRAARAEEFALYDRLVAAGGYLARGGSG